MANEDSSRPPEGPGAKCCLGVAYFNRTLERNGLPPKCLGFGQLKNGEQGNDDVRQLSSATGDFKYYCLGYSSHPTAARPARPGQPTQMPYCEGIEVAITEEQVAPASSSMAEGSSAGSLTGDRASQPTQPLLYDPTTGVAPLPASFASSSSSNNNANAAGPSGHDGSTDGLGGGADGGGGGRAGLRERFRQTLWRNADSLAAAISGEKPPTLPVSFRTYDSVAEAGRTLYDTAALNASKLRVAAELISCRTVDAVKLTLERLRGSEEETE